MKDPITLPRDVVALKLLAEDLRPYAAKSVGSVRICVTEARKVVEAIDSILALRQSLASAPQPCFECGSRDRIGEACAPCNPELASAPQVSGELKERVNRVQARMDAASSADWSYYTPGGMGDDLRAILAALSQEAETGGWRKPEIEQDDGEITVRAFSADSRKTISFSVYRNKVIVCESEVGAEPKVETLKHDQFASQEAEVVAWRYRTKPHRQWHMIDREIDAKFEREDGSEVQRLIVHPSDRGGEVKG